ncbi:MAG: GHKL domain-containing protein [Clostridia bacterium]
MQILIDTYLIIKISQTLEDTLYTKKQIIASSICIAAGVVLGSLFRCIPIINTLIGFIPIYLSLKIILKLNWSRSGFILILFLILIAITELISVYLSMLIFNANADILLQSTYKSFAIVILQYTLLIAITKLSVAIVKKREYILTYFRNITYKQVLIFIIATTIYILPQTILFLIMKYSYPIYFLFINSMQFILVSFCLFIYLKRTVDHETAQASLQTSELHNKTMVTMVDGVRTLKHDYNNIMQALNGYVSTGQYDKLKEHINKVLKECNIVNGLSVIDPKIFNEPALYGIVGAKYFDAIEKDITFELDITDDLQLIQFPMPELSRIFGILLDNAIEATSKASNKYIRLEMKFDNKKDADTIKIYNTFDTNIDFDVTQIYDKGYSTKKVKSGIGLWEVKKLINKVKHSQIYATVQRDKFVQNIIIERLS